MIRRSKIIWHHYLAQNKQYTLHSSFFSGQGIGKSLQQGGLYITTVGCWQKQGEVAQ